MALSLISENPRFSFILRKNPAAGMRVREIHDHLCYAWYSPHKSTEEKIDGQNVSAGQSPDTYCIWAQNDPGSDFYHDKLRKPLVMSFLSDFLGDTVKRQDPDDIDGVYSNSLKIELIYIHHISYVENFHKFFPDLNINIGEATDRYYPLELSTKRSIHYLLRVTLLLFLFIRLVNDDQARRMDTEADTLHVDDKLLEKYVQIMVDLQAPIYIRYLFIRNALRNKRNARTLLRTLETVPEGHPKVHLYLGDTHNQRMNHIMPLLTGDYDVMDVGCGQGSYAVSWCRKTAKRSGDQVYHAIDCDPEVIRKLEAKIERNSLNNIATYSDMMEFLPTYYADSTTLKPLDVLLVEVVEHMEKDRSAELVRLILHYCRINQLIITTPDHDFNVHYLLEGKLRHETHFWEMNHTEFKGWIMGIMGLLPNNLYQVEFIKVGNQVGEVATTQGVIIRPRDPNYQPPGQTESQKPWDEEEAESEDSSDLE